MKHHSSYLVYLLLEVTRILATFSSTHQCSWNSNRLLPFQEAESCSRIFDYDVGGHEDVNSPLRTHRPYCLNGIMLSEMKYCVYSNSNHSPNGISLITTAPVATHVANLLSGQKNTSFVKNIERSYEIADVPGKGKGLIAKRLIPAHSIIIFDSPSIILDNGMLPQALDAAQAHQLNQVAVQQLQDPDRVLSLSVGNTSKMALVDAVLTMNSFELDIHGAKHSALFPEISVS